MSFGAVNNFLRGENGAKWSYPTRGLRGPVFFNGLMKKHGMQSRWALVLHVFTTGYKRNYGRPCSCVVCSSRRACMHFSREIHSNLQDTSVTVPCKPEMGTLIGFSLTVEGNLCPGFGGSDVYFARPAVRRHLYSLGGKQECQGPRPQ